MSENSLNNNDILEFKMQNDDINEEEDLSVQDPVISSDKEEGEI